MPEVVEMPDEILSTRKMTLGYGANTVIRDLDCAIPAGAFTALIGPNGCGKSTLLRALAGMLRPRSGQVLLAGRSVTAYPLKDLAKRIGILAQGAVAPDGLTVIDLVRQGRYPHRTLFGRWSAGDETASEAALGLTGMSEHRDSRVDRLSGGQRQRAWIAMTLAQETEILLLDEPTTYLDLAHQIEVMDLMRRLVLERGKTVVAVLHDLNQASRYADRVIMMANGRIYAEGSPAEIVTAPNIEQVFNVRSRIVPDPETGTPMCVPASV
ncbi:MAG: ABC transporter ATP-binding protein [Nisaea sp.]|uniref:ABC transporter ATP-binding protein n=3 Tax=Nisaea sp. TaxID=2024842 RepID=UPI003298926D